MTNLNVFRFDDHKGIVVTPKNSRDCVAYEALAAGDIVKIKNVDNALTVVEKVTGNTDKVFGVVTYDSARKENYGAGEIVNIAYDYSIVKMVADGAIAAGQEVMAVADGMKVKAATSGKVTFGQACQKAASGSLCCIMLHRPEYLSADASALIG